MTNFDFDPDARSDIWNRLIEELEDYSRKAEALPVSPTLDQQKIRQFVNRLPFETPVSPDAALGHVIEGLKKYAVHTPHPQYYGLFNPRPAFPGILADTITAVYNPQMAAWSHAPFAVEAENRVIRELGVKFGYPEPTVDGTFTSGGAEANQTALLCALNRKFPEYAVGGVRRIDKKPVLYVSAESHHSLIKAAGTAGIGRDAVRTIEVGPHQQMKPDALRAQIEADLAENCAPVMVTATMGTTGTGAIDNIGPIAEIAEEYGLWLHADAAYGGAVALSGKYRGLIDGIHLADSITFDAHKWISVPMGAGIFLTRHPDILSRTFRITADYMPKEAGGMQVTDPYTHSLQWSRRFTGLKVYLTLLMFGWEGLDELIGRQIETGNRLRRELEGAGWTIFNKTPLPIVCFGREYYREQPGAAMEMCNKVLESGRAWISVYKTGGVNALRACITNYATDAESVAGLVETLGEVEKRG